MSKSRDIERRMERLARLYGVDTESPPPPPPPPFSNVSKHELERRIRMLEQKSRKEEK